MLKYWFKFIKNLFSFFGFIVFVTILLFLFFGETSKQRRNIFFNTLKSFAGIGEKYDGFIANTPSKYVSSIYLNLSKQKYKKKESFIIKIIILSSTLFFKKIR